MAREAASYGKMYVGSSPYSQASDPVYRLSPRYRRSSVYGSEIGAATRDTIQIGERVLNTLITVIELLAELKNEQGMRATSFKVLPREGTYTVLKRPYNTRNGSLTDCPTYTTVYQALSRVVPNPHVPAMRFTAIYTIVKSKTTTAYASQISLQFITGAALSEHLFQLDHVRVTIFVGRSC